MSVFETFLESLATASRPTLYYYHGLLPHFPWLLLPSGHPYASGNSSELFFREGSWVDNEILVAHGFQRYLLQQGYTDRLLGRLLDRLKQTGLYDRALILVASDHGFGVNPGGPRRRLDRGNVSEIANVPLFIRFPGQEEGAVSSAAVEMADLLPTVAGVLELPISWPIKGVSLLDETALESGERLFFKIRETQPWLLDRKAEKTLYPAVCVGGRVYPDRSLALVGRVDPVEIPKTGIEITGAAGNPKLGQAAHGVFVFADDQLIGQVPVNEERPEVVATYGKAGLLRSGFRFRLERSLLKLDERLVLRFFAWDSEGASELIYPENYPWKPDAEGEPLNPYQEKDCTPEVAALILSSHSTPAQDAARSWTEALKRRAQKAGPDLILPPVAWAELMGMQEDELKAQAGAFEVELTRTRPLDLSGSAFHGAEVMGRTIGLERVPRQAYLLVALNGAVSSVLPFIDESGGERRFIGMLPGRPEGLNRVRFYLAWKAGEQQTAVATVKGRLDR